MEHVKCAKKRLRFGEQWRAEERAKRLRRRWPTTRAYPCPVCGGWHVTTGGA